MIDVFVLMIVLVFIIGGLYALTFHRGIGCPEPKVLFGYFLAGLYTLYGVARFFTLGKPPLQDVIIQFQVLDLVVIISTVVWIISMAREHTNNWKL